MNHRAFWAISLLLFLSVYGGTTRVVRAEDPVDDREASFLPPPVSVLPVAKTKTNIAKKVENPESDASATKDLTVPPPFKTKAPAQAPAVEVAPDSVSALPIPAPTTSEPLVLAEPVASAPLADVDPETVGLLSPANGGLGASLWENTARPVVDRLMPAVSLPTDSAALNDLARRLFMSTAAAPLPAANGEKPPRNLIAQRIEGLMALGAVSEAWNLASLADAKWVDSVTLRQLTEAAIIGHHSEEVCKRIPAMMEAHGKTEESKDEWQKALLICQLRAKDDKAVQLGLDLMREQQVKDDIFLSLMNRNVIGGSKQLPRQLTPLRPMVLAALRQTEIPLPPELYAHPDAALVPELLLTKAEDDKARLSLAERAAAKGIISPHALAAAYQSVALTPEEVASMNSSVEKGPRARAILYQALKNEQAAGKKIELIQKYMDGMELSALCGGQGPLLAEIVGTIPVTADSNAFAPTAARLLVLAGKPDQAAAWLVLAQENAARSPSLAQALALSWPLFATAGLVPDGQYAAGLRVWLDASLVGGEDGNRLHAQREKVGETLLVLAALGYAVPEEVWQRVIDITPPTKQMTPSPLLLDRLRQAAAASRKGEAVLLSLILMGSQAGDATLGVKVDIIRALRLLGLTAEAQAVAREAIVALTD
ncbi:MAG: hypothetical protein WC612_00835 [Bdellovibrionales bacterium]|jgi:hypothetical protein